MSETDQCESFEEYWGQNTSGQYGRIERVIAKNAWLCCEKLYGQKLQAAEEKLKVYENTGMIGASPAQFMEKLQAERDKVALLVKIVKEYNEIAESHGHTAIDPYELATCDTCINLNKARQVLEKVGGGE